MRAWLYILIIVVVILYVVNPYDIIPDFLPITGWLDDTLLLGLLFYFLRKGRRLIIANALRRMMNPFGKRGPQGRDDPGDTSGLHGDSPGGTQASGAKSPHDILGVAPGATRDEIQAAYRRAVHAYHPDKVSHLGPELQELAKKKFVEIQDAYQKITRENNF